MTAMAGVVGKLSGPRYALSMDHEMEVLEGTLGFPSSKVLEGTESEEIQRK